MQKIISLNITPQEASSEPSIKSHIASASSVPYDSITGYSILKKSMDARSRQVWINLKLLVFIDEPAQKREFILPDYRDVRRSEKRVVIIGAGPAGLFAALRLIEKGIKPIILERGKDVRARRRDLATMNKQGIVNPDSNYCFGEGGAGTYSDGKLYTRSGKRGSIERILQIFVNFGAEEKIIYEAHPHIGTNKLPDIITAMRNKINECGGEVIFEQKVTDIILSGEKIRSVKTLSGDVFDAHAFILATGHSARDIFFLLHDKKILIEAKPFALGVRAEHPQQLIDNIQYKSAKRNIYLPPASYSLVQQVEGLGVFSFCMCPGGIIAPAATGHNEIVVNGWSPSKRNNPFANSGIVVQVLEKDAQSVEALRAKHGAGMEGPFSMLFFQQWVEQKAFEAGGGLLTAPAQRLVDFSKGKFSPTLPNCSYIPGVKTVELGNILPSFIHTSLQKAFIEFGKKMKGYYTNEAVVVATESRTSSPVRIPRESESLQHPQIENLYPCGEGAGYAGGIVSAAMDGERVADAIGLQHVPIRNS